MVRLDVIAYQSNKTSFIEKKKIWLILPVRFKAIYKYITLKTILYVLTKMHCILVRMAIS
jgi:hypothetical protein